MDTLVILKLLVRSVRNVPVMVLHVTQLQVNVFLVLEILKALTVKGNLLKKFFINLIEN